MKELNSTDLAICPLTKVKKKKKGAEISFAMSWPRFSGRHLFSFPASKTTKYQEAVTMLKWSIGSKSFFQK